MIYLNFNPIAFTIGPVSIGWYGIMVALAVMTLILWTLYEVKRGAKLSYDTVFNAALVGIPSGIIGARLFHVFDHWQDYSHNLGQIIGGAGLAIYGAVLGAALGVWIYSRFCKISFGYLADMLAPGIILAQAIGRVGCTLNGCCYGTECDLPWAIYYTHQSFNQIIGPVHPTQVYEIIYDLIVFFVLLRLRKRLQPDGSLFLIYLTLYSLWRFGIDFIREGIPLLFGLHEAQIIAIIVLIITITLMALKTRWRQGKF
ncbi:prolipoprotein diacylglyceryl transferase [Chloroflexota bacterium]